ncbi:Chloroperoxidase [Colletotrichum navitas]|uniref:Chloroperoxidase n=1 Tax=Colletotrichum navitas TaxID=681940 RepID=A0AAD8PMD9_9PEZI|nr:Chloroperoxidase [Colletotrichum navitas]KAK1570024.1 Chloroperoxidase [Colletotrichum navitas]
MILQQRLCLFPVLCPLAIASLEGSFDQWHPPGPGDVRCPCPMLNALANHGFLPSNGRGISLDITTRALSDGINVDPYVSKLLFNHAILTNPDPDANTFDLDHLNRHGIIEHDASLTRLDNRFGDPSVFNQDVFIESLQYWPDSVVTIRQGAAARLSRIQTSASTNVDFEMRLEDNFRSLGEVAGFYLTLGDRDAGTVNRTWLTYFLEKERLPVPYGWSRPRDPITLEALQKVMNKVYNETQDIIQEGLGTRGSGPELSCDAQRVLGSIH